MSDLQRSFAKAKLAKLPSEAPMPESMREDAWEEGSSASSVSSTGTLVPSPTRQLFARAGRRFVYFLRFRVALDATIYSMTSMKQD
jgi:protein phosphatase methylesterase 1